MSSVGRHVEDRDTALAFVVGEYGVTLRHFAADEMVQVVMLTVLKMLLMLLQTTITLASESNIGKLQNSKANETHKLVVELESSNYNTMNTINTYLSLCCNELVLQHFHSCHMCHVSFFHSATK